MRPSHASPAPTIKKARSIRGHKLVFRDADVGDAQFILSIRTDPARSAYLSETSADLEKQILWLRNYRNATNEAYFIIETLAGEDLGTVRLYDPRACSFSWGSWVLKTGVPTTYAIEAALMVYHYALYTLGFSAAHFHVRKGNKSVWQFHERFGAKRMAETELDYVYAIDKHEIKRSLARYAKYLPESIEVTL